MSDLMNLSYKRIGPQKGVLASIACHPQAWPRIRWSRGNQAGAPAMTMIWLYELAVYRASAQGPHPFGELVRRGSGRDAAPRFALAPDGRYPAGSDVTAALLTAARELIASCSVEDVAEGDYDGGVRVTVTFVAPSVADAFGEPRPQGTTLDGNYLDWTGSSNLPHNDPYVVGESSAVPDFERVHARFAPGALGAPSHVSFSRDGELLVMGDTDGNVAVWDVARAALRWEGSTGLDYPMTDFDPDGARLRVFSDFRGSVEDVHFDLSTGDELGRVRVSRMWSFSSPSRRWAFHRIQGGALVVGDPVNVALRREAFENLDVYIAANNMLYAAKVGGEFRIWSTRERRVTHRLSGRSASHFGLSPDGAWLASAKGSEIRLVRVADDTEVCVHELGRGDVQAMAWSSDGSRFIVYCSGYDEAHRALVCPCIAQAPDLGQLTPLEASASGEEREISCISLGARYVVFAGYDKAELCELSSGRRVWEVPLTGSCLVISLDEDAGFVALNGSRGLCIFDLVTGARREDLEARRSASFPRLQDRDETTTIDAFELGMGGEGSFCLGPDERRLYLDEGEGVVGVWNLETRARERGIQTGYGKILSFSVSHGARFLGVSGFHEVKILSLEDGTPVSFHASGDGDYLDAPVWSPCGRWVALAHRDGNDVDGYVTVHAVGG